MFASAKTFAKPAASPKSKSRTIAVEGIREIGALKLITENLASVQTTLTDELKSYAINEVWLKEGRASGTVPANFRAVENSEVDDVKIESHGSVQLRPKSSRQVLKDEEVALFDLHEIPYKVQVEGVETFIINPAYAENIELLEQIEAALAVIPGLPADLFMKQEAKRTNIVSEATLPAIFKLAAAKVTNPFTELPEAYKIDVPTLKSLVATATAPALTPNFGSTDIKKALKVISGLIDLTVEVQQEAAAPKAEAPVRKPAGSGLMAGLKASLAAEQAKAKKPAKAA